jgi:hypothetical protein
MKNYRKSTKKIKQVDLKYMSVEDLKFTTIEASSMGGLYLLDVLNKGNSVEIPSSGITLNGKTNKKG